MKKAAFIDLVAERAQMTKKAAADAVEAIFDTTNGAIAQAIGSHGRLSIPGFGRFSSRKRAARKGRNPRTGAVVDIPERTTLAFNPGKGIRDTMSGSPKPTRTRKTTTKKASPATSAKGSTASGGAAKAKTGGTSRPKAGATRTTKTK